VPYQVITDKWWPTILQSEDIWWDQVMLDFIAQKLLLTNHFELVANKDEPEKSHYNKAKEAAQFNRWNNYMTTTKFYRVEKQTTAGGRVLLRFVNEGVWQENKLLSLPGRTMREFQYRSSIMQKQPEGFMTDDRVKLVEQLGNVVQMFDTHAKVVTIPYQQKAPVELEQEKPKAKARKLK